MPKSIDAWTLADGRHVYVRHVQPSDEAIAQDFFRGLTSESRVSRFMGEVREVPRDTVSTAVHPDPRREMTLVVAHDDTDGTEVIAGGARYVAEDDGRAEFGMTIADAWQDRGIGTRLLPLLEAEARANGFGELYGLVLAANTRMLSIARKLGYQTSPVEEDRQVRRVGKAL